MVKLRRIRTRGHTKSSRRTQNVGPREVPQRTDAKSTEKRKGAPKRPSQFCKKAYFFAAAWAPAYFFWKRSTRPAVSTSFCLPVKNGWQLEQISTRSMFPLIVERVSKVLPQAQCTVTG